MHIFPIDRFLTFYPLLSLFLLKYSYPELSTGTHAHAFKTCAPANPLVVVVVVVVVLCT